MISYEGWYLDDDAYRISRIMLPEYSRNPVNESRQRMSVYADGSRWQSFVGTATLRPWMKESSLEGKLEKELKVPEKSRGRRTIIEPPARTTV
jgi:hypothetical protein